MYYYESVIYIILGFKCIAHVFNAFKLILFNVYLTMILIGLFLSVSLFYVHMKLNDDFKIAQLISQ